MIVPALGRFRPFVRVLCSAVWAVLFAACTTLQVPVVPPDTTRLKLCEGSGMGYHIRVWPLVDPELYAANFDEFLPGIGIAAIWLEVDGQAQEVDPGTGTRWVLRTPQGQKRALTSRQVLDRYYQERRVRAYSTKVDTDAEHRLRAVSLGPHSYVNTRGYLFFPVDARAPRQWTQGATLALVAGHRTIIETSLSDAAH
jgi:hypothetical protein